MTISLMKFLAVKDVLKSIAYCPGVRGSDFTNEIEKRALDLGPLVITSPDEECGIENIDALV